MPSDYKIDDYHTLEAIGKGKYSMVYKARRRKTIRYYAIKKVEKGQRSRVKRDFLFSRAVIHENVLKIVACYETRNSLWLVLEYCVGGDLLTMLSQDLKLPEPSIMKFASDMFVGVRTIHSKGLIHCDLKPSNMLLDENGNLKVRGFGLSKEVTVVAAKSGSSKELAHRGTPCYMAPEMFTSEGVHSYATDLWELGCTLYECAAGRPPFTSTSLTSLIEQILEHEPNPLPASCSTPFKSLVFGLLNKRPHQRLRWDQVVNHEFWRERGGEYLEDMRDLGAVTLPAQPTYEAFADMLKREDLAMKFRMLGNARESTSLDVRESFMPVLTPSLRQSVNASKLSRIARFNLQREEVGSYGSGNNAAAEDGDLAEPPGRHEDVELEHPDAELNFTVPNGMEDLDVDAEVDERAPVAPKSPPRQAMRESYGNENRSDNFADTTEDFREKDVEVDNSSPSGSDETTKVMLTTGEAILVDSRSPVSASRSANRSAQTADEDFEDTSSSMRSEELQPAETPAFLGMPEGRRRVQATRVDAAAEELEYEKFKELCLHEDSDLTVRPIVSNHKIEAIRDASHDPSKLPFQELSVNEMMATSQVEREAFLSRIYRAVAHPANVQDKVNTLAYFETLCRSDSSANVLVNSTLMPMFVKVLASSKSSPLRIRMANILGLLMRYATFIGSEFAKTDAAKVLAEAVSDENPRVRRRAMSALGELSFYVSNQARADAPQVLGITQNVIEVFLRTIEHESDEITRHYACKSVENILKKGSGSIQEAFATCRATNILVSIVMDDSLEDELRGTAASALASAVRVKPESIYVVVGDDDHSDEMRAALIKMLDDRRSKKVQQAALNLLCLALVDEKSRLLATLMEVRTLLPILAGLYERSQSSVIKAKSLLSLALLIRGHPKWLQSLCRARVLPMIECQQIDDPYLQNCCDAFIVTVVALVPKVNDIIFRHIARLRSAASRNMRPQVIEPFTLFPVIHHLMQSSVMRQRMLNSAFVRDIARYIEAAEFEEDYNGREEFRVCVKELLEHCHSCTDEIVYKVDAVTKHLLPALCDLLEGSTNAEMRFSALKLVYELILPLRADLDIATQSGCDERIIAHRLDQLLMQDLYPMCSALIDMEHPFPLYALKLLSGTARLEPALCREIINLGLAPRFFDFLSLEHTNYEPNIHLCLSLARSKSMKSESLWEYDAPAKVARVFEYTYKNDFIEPEMIEPALGIAAELLHRAQSASRVGDAGLDHVTPLLDIAPTLRKLADAIPDGSLKRELLHALDVFNAH